MHKIKSITVEGFRRQEKPVRLSLSPEANFLIGRNGTGKTSFINLINACLITDSDVLTDTIFDKVLIRFKKDGKPEVPSIEVEKLDFKKTGSYVRYLVRQSASSEPEVFELSFGRRRVVTRYIDGHRRTATRPDDIRQLRTVLSDLFDHTWLSLHRGHEIAQSYSPHEYEYEFETGPTEVLPGVDRKLDEVLDKLRQYYFGLDRLVTDQTRQFQKDWFLSFLANEDSDNDILSTNIDFEAEKSAIASIFNRFEVPSEAYEEQLDYHADLGAKALEAFKKKMGVPLSQFFNLYDVVRLHRLVEQWQDLQEIQKQILEPKTAFVEIASEMLYRKSIALNQANEVIVHADDELKIPVSKLSSGEKQLLIFLAETLLQEKRPFIFLADEPELSLHVEWQEQLVANLLKINPNAQVLFATHSPDIVGPYSDHLFSMEKLVS